MRIVALEEHFVVPELVDAWRRVSGDDGPQLPFGDLAARLGDLGDGRIAAMDDQGIDVQVLSLTSPGVQNLAAADAVAIAREANDALADAVAARPDRLQAFASVPTPDAEGAAEELERAIARLRFRGALLNGRTGTVNADDARYDDLYGVAERLRAPLYLHPQTPTAPIRQQYYEGFGDEIDPLLGTFGIGWHYETGVQLLRMVLGGVFDRHPDLQVVVGHWGEVVLFFLERVAALQQFGLRLDRPLADYFRQNVWVTGSGMLSDRYARWTAEVVGVDRILYATDYPYVPTGDGKARAFFEGLPFTDEQRAAIGSGTWEALTGHLAG